MAPSFKLSSEFSIILFSSKNSSTPKPSHRSHAPAGELNENNWNDLISPNLKAPLFLSQAAAKYLRKIGINISDPISADTAFTPSMLNKTDAYLAMYHDQGLPVMKALSFGNGINITLGVPIIRTSVDHGIALDIAGSGKADTSSLENALHAASSIV